MPALLLLTLDSGPASAGPPKSKKSSPTKTTKVSAPEAQPESKIEVRKAVNQIDGLTVEELDDGTTILRLLGHVEPTFNVYRLSDPDRLVVDIAKSERGKAVPHVPVDSWAVGRVTISSVEEHDSKIARVVVNLKRESSYIVVPKGRDLAITLTPREVAPEAYFARKSAGERQAEIETMKANARKQASAIEASAKAKADVQEAKASSAEAKASSAEAKATDAEQRARSAEKRAQAAAAKAQEADRDAAKVRAEAEKIRAQAEVAAAKREREAEALAAKQASEAETIRARAEAAASKREREAEATASSLESAAQARASSLEAAAAAKLSEAQRLADARKSALATAEKAASDAERAASEAERKAKHADQRAAEAKAEAEAAELYASRVRQSAEAKAKQAELLLSQAEAAMSQATEESEQAVQAHADAKQALSDARKAARKLGKHDDSGRDELQRAVQQAEAATAAAKQREDQANGRLAELQRDHDALSLALETKQAEAQQLRGELETKRSELATANDSVRQARAQYEKLGGDQGPSEGDKRAHRKAKSELAKAETDLGKLRKQTELEQGKLEALQHQVAVAGEQLGETLAATQKRRSLTQQWEQERDEAGYATVRDVRFEDGADGARVIVELDGPVVYDASSLTPNMTMLELRGAKIPSGLERSLDTTSFHGPIDRITSFREGNDVKIVVASALGDPAGIELDRAANRLIWKFPKLARDEAPLVASDTTPERTEVVSLGGNKVSGFSTPPVMAARPGTKVGNRSRWRGERIDIELQDAPIKDVLLLFSDIGRVNIIAGPEVTGTVTMKLSAVPWDQALDIILRSLTLGMIQEGNVIRVSTQTKLEEERRKAIEEANAAVQLKALETRLIPLSYATVTEMLPKVQSVMSSRGSVTPDTRTNTLIVMDVAENIALAESLVRQLDSQTPQVLIEARIVEARTNWLRQLGIQWGFDFIASPGSGNPTGLLFPNALGVAGGSGGNQSPVGGLILPGAAANPNYAVDLPAPVSTGTGGALGFSFGSLSGNLNTNLRLSAAEDEGEVRIISAPKIVTLDNTEAQIEQGVQIPISQVSAQGVNTRYVNATLGLRVTPHVTNEGAVMLEVQVQKNEADFVNTGARGDPTILTKSAQSQLLIVDGDTAVIGGIYTRNQAVSRSKVPWFADIPIIGWFFKNKTERDDRSEMLIFLTPRIVNRSTSIGG
ncbi:Type IV pilus biogenesis protein PilQ [Enhygromyxa salina]|uniref:Type IV pilus biogenesis protein PilQ n=1 Tax=Enhygromyxa salina TaxID=215803 RepID=A0A0C2A4F9_9BACT|nr:type IV pilus secretin family protein [Enhygromyxa salina]KIG18253.1 Type IV pilus biogenesis protein PilQ [Enhygromyxa salina]